MTNEERAGKRLRFKRSTDRIFFPAEKTELGERKLEPIRNDTLSTFFEKPVPFTGNYRKNLVVLDILAKKYSAACADYADQEDEHFILGPAECREALDNSPCAELKKISGFLDLQSSAGLKDKICAIYLLGVDNSDENRQTFVLVSPDDVFLRDPSLALTSYPFAEVFFSDEGLGGKDSEILLDWSFDERFLEYMREINFIKYSWPRDIPLRHPFLDLGQKDGAADVNYADACMDFFIDAAGEMLDVNTLLRLENLAALLRLREDVFLQRLRASSAKKITKNDLLRKLNAILNLIGPDFREVFFLCLVEICANSRESPRQKDLLEILRRKNFAGKLFVDAGLDLFASRKKACAALEEILREIPEAVSRVVAQRQYAECFDLELLNTGAKYNV